MSPIHCLCLLALSLPTVALQASQDEPASSESPRGLQSRAEGAIEGYTLFTPLRSTDTYLVDMDGEVRHVWPSEYPPGNSVYLLPSGNLLRCGRVQHPHFNAGGQGGRLQELAWDGELVWDYDLATDANLAHHDVAVLPSGNVLVIAFENKPVEEAVAAGREPGQTSAQGFWPDVVLELEPVYPDSARVVWEWHSFDHLVQDLDPEAAHYGSVADRPERIDINGDHRRDRPASAKQIEERLEMERQMRAIGYVGEEDDEDAEGPREDGGAGDWLHTNSIDYDAERDLILLSARRFSEVWVIDHSTTVEQASGSRGGRWAHGGDLLYRFGNPRAHGAGSSADQVLFAQHDASWLAPDDSGALRVLVFNNGNERPNPEGGESESYSSVDEFVLPFSAERGFNEQAPRLTWSYPGPDDARFHASFISGAQRLSNGNTLICDGPAGRLFEVTREGAVVWDYLNPYGGEQPLIFGAGPHHAPGDGAPAPDSPGGQPRPNEGPGGESPEPGAGPGSPEGGDRGDRGHGGGDMIPKGLFRGTRLAGDHPGLPRDL